MNSIVSAKRHIRQLLGWLGDREEQLQLALDAADLATWHWNPAIGELVWSDRCRQMIGVRPDVTASLEGFMAQVHVADRDRLTDAIATALRLGGAYSEEFRVVLPTGEVRWLHSMGRAQLSKSRGDVLRMSGVLRDITDLRRAAEALAAQRQLQDQGRLWASAFEHSSSGMAIVNPATCTLNSVNAAYARLLGYQPEELAGRSVFTLYPESEHANLKSIVDRCDAVGSCTAEIRRLHRDGTVLPTLLNMVSVRDGQGSLLYRLTTVTDLSEREHNLAKLRQQEALQLIDQRFRLLAESAPVGILLADPDGAVNYANPAWLAITAIPLGDALRRGWFERVHPDDRMRVHSAWDKTLDGSAFDMEFRYQRPNGEVRWVHAHASPITDPGGAVLGYVRVTLDITDRLLERATSDQFHSQVRLLAQRLQELREVERNEVASSLQQGVYRGLWEIKAGLERAVATTDAGTTEGSALVELTTLADATLDGLRRTLFDLTPPGIGELGFTRALERYADEQSSRSGVRIVLSLPPEPMPVQQEVLVVLYAVAQQAIENALEHASATRVEVELEARDGGARLRVNDNGTGMGDKDRNKPGCFGLLAVSERLRRIGGTLRVMGVAGTGTRLEARVLKRRPQRGP
jgi:PAS domain S-box-containing protein